MKNAKPDTLTLTMTLTLNLTLTLALFAGARVREEGGDELGGAY